MNINLELQNMLKDFSKISAINPALMAGAMLDPFGRLVATAAFVWPHEKVISIAPVVSPLGGDGISHIMSMPNFAGTIRQQLGHNFVDARLLHIAYLTEAPAPLNSHFWMNLQGACVGLANDAEVSNWVPESILKNCLPDRQTREYLRDLNTTGEKIRRDIISRLGV